MATLSAFLTPFMGSSINLAIPAIGQDLNGTAIMLNWIVTSFLLVSAAFLLPFGRLADMYGRKRIFVAGIGVFGAASFLCALSSSLNILLLARILQGLGATMMFATGMALLTAAFPPQERGRVLGINAAMVTWDCRRAHCWRLFSPITWDGGAYSMWSGCGRFCNLGLPGPGAHDRHPVGEERYDALGHYWWRLALLRLWSLSLYTVHSSGCYRRRSVRAGTSPSMNSSPLPAPECEGAGHQHRVCIFNLAALTTAPPFPSATFYPSTFRWCADTAHGRPVRSC